MARKPTKAELRKAMFNSPFTEDELNDPEVAAIRARLAARKEEPRDDFSDVTVTAESGPTSAGATALDQIGAAFRGGLADVGADLMFGDVDAAAKERVRKAREDEEIKRIQETNAFGRVFGRGVSDPLVEAVFRDPISPQINRAAGALGSLDSYRGLFNTLSSTAATDRAAAETEIKGLQATSPIRSYGERAILDVAGSPQSLASIPGGPFAAIPALTTYNDEYRRGREAGLSPQDAAKRAEQQAAVEGGISAIPAGKVLSTLGKPFRGAASRVTSPIRSSLAEIATRTGRTAVGEGLEESVQFLASQGIDKAISETSDDPVVAEFAKRQLSQNLWADTLRSGLAGVAGGGGLGGLSSAMEVARENGALASDALQRTQAAETGRAQAKVEAEAARAAQEAAEAKRLRDSVLPGEMRGALQQRANNIEARLAAADEEVAALEQEQITKFQLAEEAGLQPEPFDALKLERARENKQRLTTAQQDLSSRLTADQEGRAFVAKELAAQEAANAPPRDRNLEALSTGTSRRTTPKAKTASQLAEAQRAAQEADLRAFAQADNKNQAAPTTSAARTLVGNLGKNRNSADAKRALSLISSGRVEIVNSLADLDLPEIEGAKTRGVEKDGKIYIVAENIDRSADVAPQLAATLFHEIKHSADFGRGDTAVPDNLAGFIGMENAKPINAKIEQAAERGNKLAKQAVDRAKTSGVYDEELIPHFITASKEARNRASGLSNVAADLRTAVRQQYNKLFNQDAEVSLDDVYKLSEQLTDYVAQNPQFNTSPAKVENVDGRRMIISKGTGEALALSKGRTYLSSDGNRKYEIDDSKSRLTLPDQIQPGQRYTAKDILNHEELYRELPELADTPIQFVSEPDSRYGASYDAETNTITVNSAFIGPNANKFNSNTHQYVVHEMQHAAQKASGTTNGANPEMFLSPRGRQLRQQKADLQAAINFSRAMGEPTGSVADELAQIEADYDAEMDIATDKYKKVLGEQEAYSTAERIPLTDAERQEATSDVGRNLEQGFIERDGGTFSERGKRLDAPVRREAMTPEQRQIVENKLDRAKNLVASFASAYGRLGREAGQIAEAATGESSYYADLGYTTGRLIAQGTNDVAARLVSEGRFSSMTQAQEFVSTMVKGRIENLNKIDSEDRRKAAIAGLVREYPELAPLQDAYNIINDNTRLILRNMLASKTGPLTDLEIKKMNTLRNNTTRYLTTVYGLFQGKDGSKWADKVAREYATAKGQLEKTGQMSDKIRENYEIYKNALDYVTRNDVAVFDPERLQKLPKEKIDLIYDTWFSDRQGFQDETRRTSELPKSEQASEVRQALIDRIIEKGGIVNAQQIENRANSVVRGLLGLNNTNNPIAQYYRGFKQDKGILMDRTAIAEPIRALFDEITDPALRVMMTISRQGELIARTRMLAELKESLYGDKIVSNEDKANDASNRFTEQLKGESWGPLEGYWVTPDVYSVVDDAREITVNMEGALGRVVHDANAINSTIATRALSSYIKLAGIQKLLAIVWNPAQTMWNLGGSWISLIKEGNVNPKVMVRATTAAGRLLAKELRNAGLPRRVVENDEDVSDLIRYDIIDSAMVQEIRQMPFEYSRQAINSKNPILGNLGKGFKVTKAGVTQLFALSDMTAKIANYFKQVDVLTAYYKAEGTDISEDAIKREAANIIKDTNISFRRTAPIFKMSERLGLTYVMPYIQGVFRSSVYGYVHGVRDIIRANNEAKTTEGRNILLKQGMGRIAGSSVALFAIQALAKSVLTGDEEKDAKIRQLQFADARYGDSVYVGDDTKGNKMMLRLSRFDPYGPLTDILRILTSDATKEQKNRDTMEHLKELLIKPRLGQELLAGAYEFVSDDKTVKSKQTKLERIFPQATEKTKDFIAGSPRLDYADGEQLISVLDTMLPGASNIIDPGNALPAKWSENETENNVAKLLTAMGGRLDTINPKVAAISAAKDLDEARKEARERVFNRLSTVNPNDRHAVVAVMDGLDEERKAFLRLKEVYEGMQALGMSRQQINDILKEQAKVSEHDRHLLFSGKYDTSLEGWKTKGSSVLSKKSLEQRSKISEDRDTDPVKAAQRTESVNKAVKVLKESGYKVKE